MKIHYFLLLLIGILLTSLAQSEAKGADDSNEFAWGFNVTSGSMTPASKSSFVSGASELELGMQQQNGLGFSFVGQSMSAEPYEDAENQVAYDGATVGGRIHYRIDRLHLFTGVSAGSLTGRSLVEGSGDVSYDDSQDRYSTHTLVAPHLGLGISIFRSKRCSFELLARSDLLMLDREITDVEDISQNMVTTNLGLGFTFFPSSYSNSNRSHVYVYSSDYNLFRGLYYLGRAGSSVGLAASKGLLAGLLQIR